ncbi:asparagine synthetase B [Bacillus sp. RO2]|uniref:asparagine synthase-related protein n=1 Tax=Bacillus sp. RO2 TaxID=2723913 RepID=UPI00145D9C9D|nr:asparagine synthase-related protein [Bacillus sp. RO2]NMH75303.1 asparagine synthetase B [Bacillus sp. RO2]
MSAIAGIHSIKSNDIPLEHRVDLMKGLSHFPADDVQTWQKGNMYLGSHLQWITPESVGESNPLHHREMNLVIAADAIIDNRIELFERLQIPIYKRDKITDTELILEAYQKWEDDSPKYLIGDFAFIIWDEGKNQIFGARDFSGTRTLYYFLNQEYFAFCTTLKPLLALPYITRKLNESWLAEYLAIPGMYETIDANTAIYQGIKQIPPSHTLTLKNGQINLSRYIKLDVDKQIIYKTNEDYEEAFKDIFQTAVNSRIRTNRNVGAQLSGGLDSGSVVGYAARELVKQGRKLHTYSYIPPSDFKQWTPKHRIADETPYIQSTVQYVGNIKDNYLAFNNRNPYSEIDTWLETYEMPYKFFHNSFWVRGVYEMASQDGVGTLLNGARGNWSVSWGPYLDYQTLLLKQRKFLLFYKELDAYSKNIGVKKSKIFSKVLNKAYPTVFSKHNFSYKIPSFINQDFASQTGVFNKLISNDIELHEYKTPNAYEARKKCFDQVTFWNSNGTVNTKLSLKYKLWNRDPTNDLRVIKFCLSIPESQFVQNGFDRALIRRATKGILPEKVRLNQRVRGIQGSDSLFRMLPLWKDFILELETLVKDPLIKEYLNTEAIKNIIANLKNNPRSENVFDLDFAFLMRSLITYRFLKKYI